MKTFLEHVAQDILQKYGTDLSRLAVVFPNKRASLFLNDALARLAGRPLWSPAYITISDLFRRQSRLQVADDIKLVCNLHRIYTRVTGYDETLDHFYGWGQLLLSDFDDIDKNMAPTKLVFANLRDLHELDDDSYLTPQQLAVIHKFFANFSEDHNSLLKERFLRLWSHMGDIYRQFNDDLSSQGLAYEGALYRQVAEDETAQFDYERYLFVGFNLLQPVEQRLFSTLHHRGQAAFYWDYDHYYMKREAGRYIAQYLEQFPNELDNDRDEVFNLFRQPKDITFVSAPTENIQARYVSTWLQERQRIADGRRTAIVLCDEGLLRSVVHSLPPQVEHVNITTGYPLQQAPVAVLIQQLISLQTQGYSAQRDCFRLRFVNTVLRHPYAHYVSPEANSLADELNTQKVYYPTRQRLCRDEGLQLLFGTTCDDRSQLLHWLAAIVRRIARQTAPTHNATGDTTSDDSPETQGPSPFTIESLFRAYTLLNRLCGLVDSGELVVDVITLQRLVTQLLQQASIPFHGEPAVGLQVMGVLETRNLDFDHVLLLSCNEGNMPRGVSDSSFIPYSLRKAFGLTTVDNKVAIYAYYFHRLLSRSRDVTICYNNATSDGHTGEMSSFMLQLLVESPHPIRQLTLQGGQLIESAQPRAVAKSPDVVDALKQRFAVETTADRPLLTPTAINRYMRCPLQFYYCYVEGLREPDDNDDDTIDNRVFGNIFHEAAQMLYERIMRSDKRITPDDLDAVIKTKADIEMAVDAAFRKVLFQLTDDKTRMPELNGMQIINREVIVHYLTRLLIIDRQLAPFTIVGLEHDVVQPLAVRSLGITTTIGGRIDRLDCVMENDGPRLRVIDYKTGARRLTPLKSVDDIFNPEQLRNHNDYYLQTLLYARLVRASHPDTPTAPALLFIQHAATDDYDPVLRFGQERINDMATPDGDRFVGLLAEKIEEIFHPDIAFVPTDDRDRCATCPYVSFCGKTTKLHI